jgi:hypothetical protein
VGTPATLIFRDFANVFDAASKPAGLAEINPESRAGQILAEICRQNLSLTKSLFLACLQPGLSALPSSLICTPRLINGEHKPASVISDSSRTHTRDVKFLAAA